MNWFAINSNLLLAELLLDKVGFIVFPPASDCLDVDLTILKNKLKLNF